ncbi:MAG: inosine/xanthosine triphosphatase [Candidatus Methanoplasma sp.]|jgi:inosine/xanthosine triphosphatase|nr:inosine/xanthosine triphosphatase [Candidatus Methanoplasma sp.]
MKSAVAGTFNILHEGHKRLIRRAFDEGDAVIIGITSDEMAADGRRELIPLSIRRKEVESFLRTMDKPWEVTEIEDIYGPRDIMDSADVLIVSEETESRGELLNAERISRGVRPLDIITVPFVRAYDNEKISSTGVMNGKYSRDGGRGTVRIAVGSLNRIKIEAVRTVMERIFGNVTVIPCDVKSGVPEQPKGPETRTGALNRAEQAIGDHDMSVGIEAGVFDTDDGLYDFQYCAVLDRDGRMTVGVGPGFRYPDKVAELVSEGMTVGEAVKRLYNCRDIGRRQGAVGLLSKGLLDRKTLTEQSVTAAMIPRMEEIWRLS